ncbi:hypothetical protein [Desulfobulbus propionicus]
MIILSHGMAKSASSFTVQIILGLVNKHCELNGFRNFALGEFIKSQKSMFVYDETDIDVIVKSILHNSKFTNNDFVVIKLHRSCTPFISSLIDSRKIIALSSYRDPRDMALSLIDAGKKDEELGLTRFTKYKSLEDTIPAIKYQLRCSKTWAASLNTLFIPFVDLASKPYDVANKISNHLSIDFHKSVVDELINDKTKIWEYNKGKKIRWIEEFGEMDTEWTSIMNDFYDFVNQINRPYKSEPPAKPVA